MNDEYTVVASEVEELQALLAVTPEENVIERMSLESRLDSARAQLAELEEQAPARKARLTFRGRPVVGSHGMFADFASRTAGSFSDAFTAVAASLSEGLGQAGPIPNKESNQLLITGTALGSFGFEFELPTKEPDWVRESEDLAEEAMNHIERLFRLSAEGNDDEVAEVIEEVHPRAVKKVHEFLDHLVQQQAWCSLEFGERAFRFTDYDQIRESSERLKDENIQEWEETYQGEFQGVLPTSRTFEFQPQGEGALIKGKVDASIQDPDLLNREWLHRPVSVNLHVMKVGQGHPRFSLMSLNDVAEGKEE